MTHQQLICQVMQREMERAHNTYLKAAMDCAAAEGGAKEWERQNADGMSGGFTVNPYNTVHAKSKKAEAEETYRQTKDAYEFAVKTFLSPQQASNLDSTRRW